MSAEQNESTLSNEKGQTERPVDLAVLSEFPDVDTIENIEYVVKASRQAGEKYLAELAIKKLIEFRWIYNDNTETWTHLPYETQFTTIEISQDHKVKSTGMLFKSSGSHPDCVDNELCDYHTHPNVGKIEEKTATSIVEHQLPSPADITSFACLNKHKGYNKFGIISYYGTTRVEAKVKIESDFSYKKLDVDVIKNWIDKYGIDIAVLESINTYQIMLGKYFDFSHKKHTDL